ncbi:MAG TPA: hypothetical protein VFV01_14875 [Spirillospora sp.]|nr:hypothetical protein [Spirillospora sp.]
MSDQRRAFGGFFDEPQESPQATEDALLGHIATILLHRGDAETARLLLDVENVSIEPDEQGERDLWLDVAPEHMMHFTQDVVQKMRDICQTVSQRRGFNVYWVGVRETLPEVGANWREQLRDQLSGKRPTNQARKVRVGRPQIGEDYLFFTNPGELKAYQALKKIQENELPKHETIGIYPLAGGRVLGRTWEPDVLVTYKGRAGVLEVDGPHHAGRLAFDHSRDHLLRDTGIAFVDRVPVEVLNDPEELHGVLQRFLRRLAESR